MFLLHSTLHSHKLKYISFPYTFIAYNLSYKSQKCLASNGQVYTFWHVTFIEIILSF